MIDRLLGPGLQQGESFYFQLIPISLTLINKDSELPPRDTTYRFTIFKGSQKFDENRIPINAEFVESGSGLHALPITSCRLNFYVPSLIKGRKTEFILRLIQHEGKEDYELGDFGIDVNDLVDQFKKENVSRHQIKANFSEDYELEFEIYVDTNRVALEKNIREKKTDRAIKSPLRQRKEPRDEGTSARKNLTQEEKPSRDQEPTPKEEPAEPLREEQTEPPKEEKVEAQPTPQVEAIPEPQREPEPKVSESRRSGPAAASVKEKVGSVQSKPGVPLVQTTFKPLAKPDCPSEIKMTESQRLANDHVEHALHHSGQQCSQQRLFLYIFMVVGVLLTYWAMTPSLKC